MAPIGKLDPASVTQHSKLASPTHPRVDRKSDSFSWPTDPSMEQRFPTPRLSYAFLACIVLAQFFLFSSYIEREASWNYVLHGDPTWYVYFNYDFLDALTEKDWTRIWGRLRTSPWGSLLFFEAAATQLMFGADRMGIAAINLVYFTGAQIITFVFFYRLTGRPAAGWLAIAILMSMQTPFRGDGPGLNISDFHFDLVLFYLLLGIHLQVAVSDCFLKRNAALVVGLLGAVIVATRLVSVFLLTGVFGLFGMYLVWRWYQARNDKEELEPAATRVRNFLLSALVYMGAATIPVAIANRALYHHYFRFVFDEEFSRQRAGMYVMGATTKLEEAWEVLIRMLHFDFGWAFLVSLITLGGLYLATRGFPKSAAPTSEEIAPIANRWLADKVSARLDLHFLLISAVASYVMHVVFPIKSDHLTRMTAAPLVILATMWAVPRISAAWTAASPGGALRRFLKAGFLALGLSATYVQLGFYASAGRYADQKREIVKVQDIYSDIAEIVRDLGIEEVAISVDRVGSIFNGRLLSPNESYELGALYSFFTYAFERENLLLTPRPKFGSIIDEAHDWARAKTELASSDFVLIGPYPYTRNDWPLTKSVFRFSDKFHAYVKANFCLYREYELFGEKRSLYVNPASQRWRYDASASVSDFHGPQGLIEGTGHIWHAPWTGTHQWVEFAGLKPLALRTFGIMAQDGVANRAPRDFVLHGFDEDTDEWVTLLTVNGADYTEQQLLEWPIDGTESYRRYRVNVLANAGDPTLLTIQKLSLKVTKACRDISRSR